jgi:CBS domain-containing protein
VSEDRLIHARRLLLEHDIQRLPVIEEGQVVGLIAEWEMAKGFARFLTETEPEHQKHGVRELLVGDWMVRNVVSIRPDATAREAAKRMIAKGVGGLPVLSGDGKLVGIVTRTDLIHTIEPKALSPGTNGRHTPRTPAAPSTALSKRKGRGPMFKRPR